VPLTEEFDRAKSLPHNLVEMRRDWAVLSAYERFEAFGVLALVRRIIVTDLSAIAPDALAAEAALILAPRHHLLAGAGAR
jgi:hypothetical protein